MGGVLGMMKTAGMGLGAYGKTAISNVLGSKTAGTGAMRAGLNFLTGGMSGAFGEGKTAVKKMMKDGFTAIAGHLLKNLRGKKE